MGVEPRDEFDHLPQGLEWRSHGKGHLAEHSVEAENHLRPVLMPKMVNFDIDPQGPCKPAIEAHCSHLLAKDKPGTSRRSLLANPISQQRFPKMPRIQKVSGNSTTAMNELIQKWNVNSTDNTGAPVAKCLRNAMVMRRSSIASRGSPMSESCKQDIRTFFVWRAQDIRQDFFLMSACSVEIKELCPKVKPGDGRVISCLKAHKPTASSKCSKAISKRQMDSGEDIALDAKVSLACAADLEKYCKDVRAGGGLQKACLEAVAKKNKADAQLGPKCKSALYRRALEDSEDIRFDYRTSEACAADKQKFCAQVPPGRARVYQCLEQHVEDKEFSADCKKQLMSRVTRKAKDIRMDYRFRITCRNDVKELCPEFEMLVFKPWVKSELRGSDLIECMREHQARISNPKCKDHMYHIQTRGAMNPALDSPLQRNCAAEIKELCNDFKPTESFMLTQCLKRKKAEGYIVSQQCTTVIMRRLIDATKDFNLNPAVKTMCIKEYSKFCKDVHVASGGESTEECLRHHRDEIGFSRQCKDSLDQFSMDTLGDIRLVKDLSVGCAAEVETLCMGIEPGEGRVISCLQEKRTMISSSGCRDALLRITGMATDDWRMDFGVYNACKQDVSEYCNGIEPGQGRVHKCLRANMDRISPRCKMMQRKLEEMEAEDIRLNPRLAVCIPAARRLCSHAPPGNAGRIACLQDHMADDDFPPECYNAMEELVEKASARFYLNPRVKIMCDEDVNRFCRWSEMGKDDPDGSILSCLASHVQEAQDDCRRELVRTVRLQMWRYKIGTPLTSPCDDDAMQYCHVGTMTSAFMQPGYVSECLLRHSGNITRACWSLISLPDTDGVRAAAKLEAKYWHREFAKEALSEVAESMNKHVSGTVAKQVQSRMKRQVNKLMQEREKNAGGWAAPLSIIFAGLIALGAVAWWSLLKSGRLHTVLRKGPLVVKDGNL